MVTKKQFLTKLNASLKKLPSDERQDILQDIEEYFAIGLARRKDGRTNISFSWFPRTIAKELVATHRVEKVEENTTAVIYSVQYGLSLD